MSDQVLCDGNNECFRLAEQLAAEHARREAAERELDLRPSRPTQALYDAALQRAEAAERERDAAQKAMSYTSNQAHLEWTRAEAAEQRLARVHEAIQKTASWFRRFRELSANIHSIEDDVALWRETRPLSDELEKLAREDPAPDA